MPRSCSTSPGRLYPSGRTGAVEPLGQDFLLLPPFSLDLLTITIMFSGTGSLSNAGKGFPIIVRGGRFAKERPIYSGQALTPAALWAMATGIGIIYYILYYRLDEISRFWNGIVRLLVDAGVVKVFLAVLVLS